MSTGISIERGWVFAVAFAACYPQASPPVSPFLRDCPRSQIEQCAIQDPDCQASVWSYTNCLAERPDDPSAPSVELIALETYLDARVDTSTTPDLRLDRALQLIGFDDDEAGIDRDTLGDFAPVAYYVPDDDTIVFVGVDRLGERGAFFVLAHEMIHAIQNRRGDLDGFDDIETTDALLAFRSLVEGEADFYEDVLAAALEPTGSVLPTRQNLTPDQLLELARTAPEPLLVAGLFPYTYGTNAAHARYHENYGPEPFDGWFDAPPTGTHQLLARSTTSTTTPPALDLSPTDFGLLAQDTFGLWLWQVFAARLGAPQELGAWFGGRIHVLHDPITDRVAVLWWSRIGGSLAFRLASDLTAFGGLPTRRTWTLDASAPADFVILAAESEADLVALEPVAQTFVDALPPAE